MRKAVVMFALVVAVLLLAGLQGASAQSTAVVKVPFSFIVEGKVMPAGEYRISTRAADPSVLRIASTCGKVAAFVSVSSIGAAKAGAEPTLVFRRIGAGYFLSRVNVPGDVVREIAVPSGAAAANLAMLASGKPAIQG